MNPHQSPAQLYTTRPKLPLTGEALTRGSSGAAIKEGGWASRHVCQCP